MITRGTGFTPCEPCGGLGFHRSGDFANRSFPRCTVCKGLGQAYLDPEPDRGALKAEATQPAPRSDY